VAAVPLAGDDVELHVHGPVLSDDERMHRAELEHVVEELGLAGRVTIGDPVPRDEIPALFAAHDALVNNMRAGAPDKVVYEAAASCLPVLASNPIFDELLSEKQRFTRWDPRSLAEGIRTLAAMGADERAQVGRGLRERVAESHSVQSWARGILDAAGLA
jgi:glycosyltransferase involved in cell wall biosynthesis